MAGGSKAAVARWVTRCTGYGALPGASPALGTISAERLTYGGGKAAVVGAAVVVLGSRRRSVTSVASAAAGRICV